MKVTDENRVKTKIAGGSLAEPVGGGELYALFWGGGFSEK